MVQALHFTVLLAKFGLHTPSILGVFNRKPQSLFSQGINLQADVDTRSLQGITLSGAVIVKKGDYRRKHVGEIPDVLLLVLEEVEGVPRGNTRAQNYKIRHSNRQRAKAFLD
jgi:hypothetical protein